MIQNTDIRMLNFDSRLVSVVVVIKNSKGERYSGQQTLATCTCLRSCFRRGVVVMVLVAVKVEGVTRMFLCLAKVRNVLYTVTRSVFAQTK